MSQTAATMPLVRPGYSMARRSPAANREDGPTTATSRSTPSPAGSLEFYLVRHSRH